MRYALKVAYDGTHFSGWQVQNNGRTVQGELNAAIFKAFGENATVTASGRTDAGVHALSQVCHVDLNADIAGEKLADALNSRLPDDVSVLKSSVAPAGFDANRSAKRKTYRYKIYFSPRRNPLFDRYAVWIKGAPDIARLCEAAREFIGEHDFAAYCASGSSVKTTVRTVYSFNIEEEGGFVNFDVCGNGFLYNMVRTLAGTALWYSLGKLTKEDIAASLSGGDRNKVGKTMPAKGLTLISVDYGSDPFAG
ncbi:MAG: tRNA pseudouridine(38-40) synthase TruA [Clostridiales bacterium]|nr:tRNA pseudouridine(38-40) synthase TruA [Clostridiales bacterium]